MSKNTAILCILIMVSTVGPAYAQQSGVDVPGMEKQISQEAGSRMDAKWKVVFHVDWDQEERLVMALENIKNLFKAIPSDQSNVQIVTNGKAVNLFRKDRAAKYASEMEGLHKQGVLFKACRNAMAKNNVEKADLLDVCEVVPAGVLELIDLQHAGFAYIKP